MTCTGDRREPAAFGVPVVATYGVDPAAGPSAPLVVLLHGRGSNEREILGLAPHLPDGSGTPRSAPRSPRVAASPGSPTAASAGRRRLPRRDHGLVPPLARRGGAGRAAGGPGRLQRGRRVRRRSPAGRAGALRRRRDPVRHPALRRGRPRSRAARLADVPVFVAQGETDTVIPRELLDRTWAYLLAESAASAHARRDPSGHGITPQTLAELGGWIGERLGVPSDPPADPRSR